MRDAHSIDHRVLRLLAESPATAGRSPDTRSLILAGESRKLQVAPDRIRRLATAGVIATVGGRLAITAEGRRLLAMGDDLENVGRNAPAAVPDLDSAVVDGAAVLINIAESPIGALARRRGKDGSPYLTPAEFQAGERLRSDYTRGQILPRTSANWEAAVAPHRRDGGGMQGLTDSALSARVRVERALTAVGPELSGILVDVCCFLKGLELVERERQWPARSAKLVLKSALGILARHYSPPTPAARRDAVLHWGADGYRPSTI